MNTVKSRGIMYVQKLDKLPIQLKGLTTRLDTIEAERWAFIVHDKDTTETATPIDTHIHVMLQFKNPRSIDRIAKLLGDSPQQFENMTKRNSKNGVANGFAYLTHRTRSAQSKYQYDPSEVTANFDYAAFLREQNLDIDSVKYKSAIKTEVTSILDKVGADLLSPVDAKSRLLNLGGDYLSKYSDKIDKIQQGKLEIQAKKWQSQKKESQSPTHVIWIFGEAGTGKTRFAKWLAEKNDIPAFTTGGSNDLFQNYGGQHQVILDELRPNLLKYEDLLKILDPWSTDSMTVARYRNAPLMADFIIVTSPFNPIEFYDKSKILDSDSFAQLERRLEITLKMTPRKIYECVFDEGEYKTLKDTAMKNTYSRKTKQAEKLHLSDLTGDGDDA